jgi:hypothetical protein
MCEQCIQIDAQIDRYRHIASDLAMDPLTRDRVARFVEDLKAEKAKLHPETQT